MTISTAALSGRSIRLFSTIIERSLGKSQLRRNIFAGAGQAIIAGLLATLSYPVYLSYLGYELYGLWLALGVVVTIAQFGNIGITSAVMKLVAEEHGKGNLPAVRAYVSTAVITLSVTVGSLVLVVVAFRLQLVQLLRLTPANTLLAVKLVPWIAALSFYVLQVEALNSVLGGVGRMDIASTLQTTARVLNFVLAFALLAAGCGISAMVISSFIAYATLHFTTVMFVRHVIGSTCLSLLAFDLGCLRRIAFFGTGVFTCSLISMFSAPMNKFMLARYGGVTSVPVYELAWAVAMQLRGVFDSALRAVMPEISRLHAAGDCDSALRVRQLRRRSIKVAACWGLPLGIAGSLLAGPALRLWLGPRFNALLPTTLNVLLIGTIVSLAAVPAYYGLLALGRIRQIIIAHIISAGTNALILVGNVALTSHLEPSTIATGASLGLIATSAYILFATDLDRRSGRTALGSADLQTHQGRSGDAT